MPAEKTPESELKIIQKFVKFDVRFNLVIHNLFITFRYTQNRDWKVILPTVVLSFFLTIGVILADLRSSGTTPWVRDKFIP